MKLRVAVVVVAAAATLLLLGGVCGRKLYPPEFISVPSEVYAGDTTWVRLAASGNGYDSVRYVVRWGDTTDTTAPLGLLDTARVPHVYTTPDTYYIGAAVFAVDDPLGIRWAPQRRVDVYPGGQHAPVIDSIAHAPRLAVIGAPYWFTVAAHDPDGDSIRLAVDWGDSTDTTTGYFASPCSIAVSHVFTKVETAKVLVRAQDRTGATSQPESVLVPVGTAGGVIWYWQSDAELGPGFSTSPIALNDGEEDCVYAGCAYDYYFYAISTAGKTKRKAGTALPEYVFTGHPAFCEATQHIIVGSDEGRVYALTLSLQIAWYWPTDETLSFIAWGAPAIRDNRLYIPRDNDSIYYLIDSVDHGVRVAALTSHAAVSNGPAIDAQGDVYFGTDSGYLYKVGPELDTIIWRTRLLANGEIHGPVIGSDGSIYCTSDSCRVYAVNPADGAKLWMTTVEGEVSRPAMGRAALFVASSLGNAYSLNPATGSINWQKSLSASDGFSTSPIVTANGYIYFASDADVLFCVNQADGTVIWRCDCPRYLPRSNGNSGRPKRAGVNDYPPNPTILPNGNIIVCGDAAVYCVAGYPDGPLDPLAPWPKWQHDVYNTGYVFGGP